MSHFSTIKTNGKITNAELLVQTLEDLGYQNVAHHQEAHPMKDYYQVRGRRSRSSNTANVIVPWDTNQVRCHSDFGFRKNESGELVLVADDMDASSLQKQSVELQRIYNQKAAAAIEDRIMATASTLNKGTPIIERTEVDGKITIAIAYPRDIQQHNQYQQVRR